MDDVSKAQNVEEKNITQTSNTTKEKPESKFNLYHKFNTYTPNLMKSDPFTKRCLTLKKRYTIQYTIYGINNQELDSVVSEAQLQKTFRFFFLDHGEETLT